jgi:hypothetical protein
MSMTKIDTLVMIIAEQNGGKSNQMRSILREFELRHFYKGYPKAKNISRKYFVRPDIDLFICLSSWHERDKSYPDVKRDINKGFSDLRRRYKVFIPAQVTRTEKLFGAEDLFIELFSDFEIRRGFAVWLNPNPSPRQTFEISKKTKTFMSDRPHVSTLAIDSLAAHPKAVPKRNSINARLLADLLFRV